VRFEDLTKDPIATVKRIYDHFGLTFTDAFHQNLVKFITHDPKEGKSSAPKVSLDAVGLTQEEVRSAFSDYISEYLS